MARGGGLHRELTRDRSTSSSTSTSRSSARSRRSRAGTSPRTDRRGRQPRGDIAGSGARNDPGNARHLRRAGFAWVTFTATRELRNTFTRLGLDLALLAPRDPARVPEEATAGAATTSTIRWSCSAGSSKRAERIAMKARNAIDDGQQRLTADALADARGASRVALHDASPRIGVVALHGRQRPGLDRRRSRRSGGARPAGSAAALFHAGADRRGSGRERCRRARRCRRSRGPCTWIRRRGAAWRYRTLIAPREVRDPPPLPPGTAKITFTSGTTGTPKGVCLDDAHQWRVAEGGRGASRRRDRASSCACCRWRCSSRTSPACMRRSCVVRRCVPPVARGLRGSSTFDPSACLHAIERFAAHSVILLPQMLRRAHARDRAAARTLPASLRFAAVGGAKVAPP